MCCVWWHSPTFRAVAYAVAEDSFFDMFQAMLLATFDTVGTWKQMVDGMQVEGKILLTPYNAMQYLNAPQHAWHQSTAQLHAMYDHIMGCLPSWMLALRIVLISRKPWPPLSLNKACC